MFSFLLKSTNSREGMMMQAKKGNLGGSSANSKALPLEDALAILMQGFLKGKAAI